MEHHDPIVEDLARVRAVIDSRYGALKDADFQTELLKRIRGRSDREVSKICNVSRPSVGRWKRGDSAPHPLGRPSIFYALDKNVIKMWLKAA